MESSSEDGSFVWTDASNSCSSGDMVMSRDGANSPGEESEYGKSYKKKLQKELFTNENGKHEHGKEVRNKKRKRDTSESEHSETTRKKIKVEPDSDLDAAMVSNEPLPNGYDERLLDDKVKKELEFVLPNEIVKKKKRKKHSPNDTDVKLDLQNPSNESNTEDSLSEYTRTYGTSDQQNEYNVAKKKKKKKKCEKRDGDGGSAVEADDHYEDTVEQQTTTSVAHSKHSATDKTKNRGDMSGDLTVNSTTADLDISEISEIRDVSIVRDKSLRVENHKDRRRLSERIQFEDEIVDAQPSVDARASVATPTPIHTKKQSEKLKRFAQKNNKLRVCAIKDSNEFTIGEHDEVWVVTCPSEVEVGAFAGRSVALEGRCKVKLQGGAYEGGAVPAQGEAARAALVVGARVRGVRLAGRLALHRRVPRAPDAPAPAPAPARAPRLPLPDTKLRHPLLGAHYKKALKLPLAVRERLRGAPAPAPAAAPARHRRRSEASPAAAPAPAPAPTTSKKEAKRRKHNLEATETWESERAIEESLFHF